MRKNYIHTLSTRALISTGILLILLAPVTGQELRKEIYVVSSYKPKIADAEKISTMPLITDTMKMETHADYTLLPSRINTDYSPRPIKPAKMVGTPLDKLYKSYLKLGFGNYVTPLAEYSIHNLRSKEYAIGAYIFHKSSHTKMELDNGAKVPAGYGKNSISMYGKKFYKDINLTADIGMNTHKVRQYGYNTENFPDSVPEPEVDDIKQSFFHLFGAVGIHSVDADSSALSFALDLRGDYYQDHFKNKEPHFNVSGNISYPIKTFRIGLNGSYDFYQFNVARKESLILLHPFVMKRKPEWEIKLAAKLFFENIDGSRGFIFPDASIRFQIVEKALITNIGITGSLENNSYYSITSENPYLIPGTGVKNTIHRFTVFAGIEGQLSRKMAYRLDVTFDAMEDAMFYVNDTNSLMQNQFDIVYDDADLIKYHGELAWMPLSNLSFFLAANYFDYKMTSENKPWHKPSANMTFGLIYNFKEKIYAEFEYLIYSKRYAKNYSDEGNPYLLGIVNDLNLKLEYKYSNILSGFINLNNILSQKYYLWNFYPNQRFNLLIGVSYKF